MRTISQLQAILDSEREWLESFQKDANPNDPFDQMAASMCRKRVEYAEKRLAAAVRAEHIATHGAASEAPLTPSPNAVEYISRGQTDKT